ncbi:hypothetical protein B296_00008590 [Ensete ventricosum]|uniref:Uncharacterized protein n=1 Tax=Ensete ventricosum TaxID=4639 RepID=A0A427APG4_ENSVE|nr:hypothetical protein B296_00008590 [Ensete ventricosum]
MALPTLPVAWGRSTEMDVIGNGDELLAHLIDGTGKPVAIEASPVAPPWASLHVTAFNTVSGGAHSSVVYIGT